MKKNILVIGSSLYYPRVFSKDLQNKMHFIDHPGFLKGEDKNLSLSSLVESIEQERQKLGISHMILVGHSIHALMALEYAKHYPQYVSHLVLIASSPIAGPSLIPHANRYFEESVCPYRKKKFQEIYAYFEKEIEKNPDNAFVLRMLQFGPMLWFDPDFDASALWKDVYVNPQTASLIWGKIFDNYKVNFEKIICPVFLALGRYDFFNPSYLWENHRFDKLTIRVFEKSGHTPQYEEQALFDQELMKWIG